MQTKTKTKPLRARDYITLAGSPNRQLNLTRLVDDALDRLETIRYTCYGAGNGRRSRYVIRRSFAKVLEAAGYTESQANALWRDQVLPLEALAINADQ